MSAGAWLAARSPAPPDSLAARMRAAVSSTAPDESKPIPEGLLAAGAAVLRELLDEGRESRDSALDLLAADALVTYAFEAAAEEPATLGARASSAMRALAALAETRP